VTSDLATINTYELDSPDIMRVYCRWLESEYSPDTAHSYYYGLQRFIRWLEDQEISLSSARRKDVQAWKKDELERCKPTSIYVWLRTISSFFEWCIIRGAPIQNPARGIRVKGVFSVRRHTRDELTAAEVLAVLDTCNYPPTRRYKHANAVRDKAIISLMAYCGLRVIEVKRAEFGDLETREGRAILWVWGKGRSGPDDFVVLPTAAENAMREWLAIHPENTGPIFVSLTDRAFGRRMSRNRIRKMVKARYCAAGINNPKKTTHSLRHSAISSAIRGGAPPLQVMAMARHTDMKTTMGYYHERNRLENPAEDWIDYGEEKES
jgi:site-specific recombinase XerD